MNERRIQRIQALIKQRVAEVVDHELNDPRRGMITITRVEVDKDLQYCDVHWSVLGDDQVVKLNNRMLQFAAPYVQREVAKILHTRTVPRVRFHHDPGIEQAGKLDSLMHEIRSEREQREQLDAEETSPETSSDAEPASGSGESAGPNPDEA